MVPPLSKSLSNKSVNSQDTILSSSSWQDFAMNLEMICSVEVADLNLTTEMHFSSSDSLKISINDLLTHKRWQLMYVNPYPFQVTKNFL